MVETPTVFCQKTRTARKRHHCCECGCDIIPGSNYVYSHGIWDGSPHGYKQCVNCSLVFDSATASADLPEEGPGFTGLREWFSDYVCRDFKGDEFINSFARDLNLNPEQIRQALGEGFFK
ncbi:hypothetical protein SLJ66_004050 [Escherichia coli]|nr:hypothetical protein [Escherichia coli]